ncbi:hypothetical protein [Mesorhizobium sp. NZP2077]|uniref:hypothetical protein n=1 Tax=Mesorhizobium sp. NZP2077 TaxID=2483404 RepID=UPI001551C3CC|nr:hypothetical protein [Mesorhizobium sp. NZP2077]QKC85266.1 hypothetical protein EB232_30205 [Mesorhizobium sp. NZP2077]QKD18907.1 hypothetical protein HGP13_29890 [Mesorhizobium sp. NZP2077]
MDLDGDLSRLKTGARASLEGGTRALIILPCWLGQPSHGAADMVGRQMAFQQLRGWRGRGDHPQD